jgi:hypothetical protein
MRPTAKPGEATTRPNPVPKSRLHDVPGPAFGQSPGRDEPPQPPLIFPSAGPFFLLRAYLVDECDDTTQWMRSTPSQSADTPPNRFGFTLTVPPARRRACTVDWTVRSVPAGCRPDVQGRSVGDRSGRTTNGVRLLTMPGPPRTRFGARLFTAAATSPIDRPEP